MGWKEREKEREWARQAFCSSRGLVTLFWVGEGGKRNRKLGGREDQPKKRGDGKETKKNRKWRRPEGPPQLILHRS